MRRKDSHTRAWLATALSALAGEVEVEVGMADIFGELCAKQLTIRGRGAKVDLTGLCGPADIDTGGGSVALEWATVPASGCRMAITSAYALTTRPVSKSVSRFFTEDVSFII